MDSLGVSIHLGVVLSFVLHKSLEYASKISTLVTGFRGLSCNLHCLSSAFKCSRLFENTVSLPVVKSTCIESGKEHAHGNTEVGNGKQHSTSQEMHMETDELVWVPDPGQSRTGLLSSLSFMAGTPLPHVCGARPQLTVGHSEPHRN